MQLLFRFVEWVLLDENIEFSCLEMKDNHRSTVTILHNYGKSSSYVSESQMSQFY